MSDLRIKLVMVLAVVHLACQVREVFFLLALGHWHFLKKPRGTRPCVPMSYARHPLTQCLSYYAVLPFPFSHPL